MIEDIFLFLAGLLVIGLMVAFLVALFVFVYDMAKARNRDPRFWVIVALIIDPFAAMILLWLLGPASLHQAK
ncbi:hypothetical protein NNA36_14100 [Shimia sp. CNT1-13L.2]|uniref:hypothetical protein n=1 Tax=Shimia sp. CNT1-13L.2 TaxID=2959663 RepID=UPI0020CC5EB0|nr:hypothetical protein [Shimia sp. CNT1-13L.2]MCP9483092.1 hypothetical protein [Shimia sp. CNT1-13L.2]